MYEEEERAMYEDLVKRLRKRAVNLKEKFSRNAELLSELMQAADAIEELKRALDFAVRAEAAAVKACMPRWIPVTERLPDEYVNVLCYCSRIGQYGCGEWCKEDNGAIYWFGLNGMIPTHWMQLPAPPKEET